MDSLFHNYKTLSAMVKKKEKEEDIFCDSITKENEIKLKSLTDNKPQGKLLFDQTYEKWQGLVVSLIAP